MDGLFMSNRRSDLCWKEEMARSVRWRQEPRRGANTVHSPLIGSVRLTLRACAWGYRDFRGRRGAVGGGEVGERDSKEAE